MAVSPAHTLSSPPWRSISYWWRIAITLALFPRTSTIWAFSTHNHVSTRSQVDFWAFTNDNDRSGNSPDDDGSKDVSDTRQAYIRARNIRTLQGHNAGIPYYQAILQQNPDDRTAGTRLAASAVTPQRQEEACGGKFCNSSINGRIDLLKHKADIQKLRAILCEHSYNFESVSRFFGVPTNQKPLSCNGPLFASPVSPGLVTMSNYPLSQSTGNVSGFSCLIALFLLSLVVPRTWIVEHFGEDNCTLMQEFGWIYPCSVDPSLMIPYVNVFPIDFDDSNNNNNVGDDEQLSLWVVTDLHPRVLSTTTVGESLYQTGNSVMYIGPDSLALVQHFSPYSYLMDKRETTIETRSNSFSPDAVYGLDLGTGSGVQALSALAHWKIECQKKKLNCDTTTRELMMAAIDINPRALRFTQFNAILNGLEDHLILIHADLVSGKLLGNESSGGSLDSYLRARQPYDLILANPPFLPVPSDTRIVASSATTDQGDCDTSTTTDSIAQRYGLFSSGGGDGEVLLQRIVELSSRHLSPGGVLGVVAEFFEQEHDSDFERFLAWWSRKQPEYRNATLPGRSQDANAILQEKGVLFLNEFPIDAATYAARRADNPREELVWYRHLESLNITAASPGMLYIRKGDDIDLSHKHLDLTVSRVPKTSVGSVWTPSNLDAIRFTQRVSHDTFGWP